MSQFRYRKSSYSSGSGSGECVEVAGTVPGTVAVRDSTFPSRATVRHSPAAWSAFVAELRAGRDA